MKLALFRGKKKKKKKSGNGLSIQLFDHTRKKKEEKGEYFKIRFHSKSWYYQF